MSKALELGLVGLPNSGKSTFSNALTKSSAAQAANFPFCTIEPNIGITPLPDERLQRLADINNSLKKIPATLLIKDIAGIVEGANQGQGLGNKFLSHIREVDIIAYVLRCFEDKDIIHVKNNVDPVDDLETLDTELMLADLESCQKQLGKKIKKEEKEALRRQELIALVYEALQQDRPARTLLETLSLNKEDLKLWHTLHLLTQKKVIYVCNVDAQSMIHGNMLSQNVEDYVKRQDPQALILPLCVQLEQELSAFDAEERTLYLETMGVKVSALEAFVQTAFKLLNLSTFFTTGPQETHAWTFTNGMLAPQCAGLIHSDFERGFIRSETISYEDYSALNGESGARANGKMRLEGKDYAMQDGDVVHFLFNV